MFRWESTNRAVIQLSIDAFPSLPDSSELSTSGFQNELLGSHKEWISQQCKLAFYNIGQLK